MDIEVLKDKALSKEIKLEDLEIEDILKFSRIGYINTSLSKYFDLSLKEVKKIRDKKGLKNTYYEELVRNLIVLLDYIKKHKIMSTTLFEEAVTKGYALGISSVRSKKENYLEMVSEINWQEMDTKKEIEKRKIDVPYRLKELEEAINIIKDNALKIKHIKNKKVNENPKIINKKKIYVPKNKILKYSNRFNRNPVVSENALNKANYLCEINLSHNTFIKKSNGKRYMEPHHLIPIEFQDYFKYSLDVEANIVSLCSHCHNEIHYGVNNEVMISLLYFERKELLHEVGLDIDIETLLLFYEYSRKEFEKLNISQNT